MSTGLASGSCSMQQSPPHPTSPNFNHPHPPVERPHQPEPEWEEARCGHQPGCPEKQLREGVHQGAQLRLVRVCAQHLGPQLQAVDALPAVDLGSRAKAGEGVWGQTLLAYGNGTRAVLKLENQHRNIPWGLRECLCTTSSQLRATFQLLAIQPSSQHIPNALCPPASHRLPVALWGRGLAFSNMPARIHSQAIYAGSEHESAISIPHVDADLSSRLPHLLVGVRRLHAQRPAQRQRQLPDRAEGVCVRGRQVQAPQLNTAGGHEGDVGRAGGADELGVRQEGAVHALQ